jgi:hypothetical protein
VLLLPSKSRWGRLQRQARRAFIALGSEVLTGELAEWCWPRRLLLERRPIEYRHRKSTARAARSIGAVRVRREGREWLWRLGDDGGGGGDGGG